MKVVIPVGEYLGLESPVYGHFGSAPFFALLDSETMAVEAIGNSDQINVHGGCNPLRALAGSNPDAVVVGGIGMGALMGLRAAGMKVYRAAGGTVADVARQFKAGELAEVEENGACAGHSAGHSCHHD
jgi:predicted Fe-Mo cluster-binding NifX family protein